MDYIYGQESPGWISLYKLITFFFWKFTETLIFLEKIIGHFQNATKNGNKVWTI